MSKFLDYFKIQTNEYNRRKRSNYRKSRLDRSRATQCQLTATRDIKNDISIEDEVVPILTNLNINKSYDFDDYDNEDSFSESSSDDENDDDLESYKFIYKDSNNTKRV